MYVIRVLFYINTSYISNEAHISNELHWMLLANERNPPKAPNMYFFLKKLFEAPNTYKTYFVIE